MQQTYTNPIYDYVRSDDQDAEARQHHPVIIVGAGPCGLAAGIDLALQGTPSVIIDDNNTVSVGSRAICFSKRTLEVMDRYGCADRMVKKGITWKRGKVFFQNELTYDFDLLPETDHKLPAFINLQQYYFEEYLVDRIADMEGVDLRWENKVIEIDNQETVTHITVATPEGNYTISCDYLLVADGANSNIRTQLGLESKGQVFQDRFLIADVVMKANFPTERWFWFDPPFHRNQSALLHRQADNVWRIDLQLGWDADPEEEKKEHNIRPRLEAMLGKDVEFDLEWASVYTFQCRKMDNFVHGRVIFMGDAAHQVSPFGARGANGGIQSVENLAWKLSRILRNEALPSLLQTYNTERQEGATENITNSTRATDFITPKNRISRIFRDETLRLAKKNPFARTLVNSGRLSTPCIYQSSPLNTSDDAHFQGKLTVGAAAHDAPAQINGHDDWLLKQLGNCFVAMINVDLIDQPSLQLELQALKEINDLRILLVSSQLEPTDLNETYNERCHWVFDTKGLIVERYDLQPGNAYLFRPDQIISARWKHFTAAAINKAKKKALGFTLESAA